MSENNNAINVQAYLHHQYFLDCSYLQQLKKGSALLEIDLPLISKQHNEKFYRVLKTWFGRASHAVARAKYHVLSNNVGGVGVELWLSRKEMVALSYPR